MLSRKSLLTTGALSPWLMAASLGHGQVLDTSFTFQGEVLNAGVPAEGLHDLRFRLFDSLAGPGQVGAAVCFDDVTVSGGRFTVVLDFGAQFTGQKRFLEIDVRADGGSDCSDESGFVVLSPRQELTASPHAAYTLNAGLLGGQSSAFYRNASNLNSGTLADTRLSGNVPRLNTSNTFTGTITATSFTGNAGLLTGLNASNIALGNLDADRLPTGGGWTLTGALVIDGGTLYVDQANDRVGIGTTTPATRFHVNGDVMLSTGSRSISLPQGNSLGADLLILAGGNVTTHSSGANGGTLTLRSGSANLSHGGTPPPVGTSGVNDLVLNAGDNVFAGVGSAVWNGNIRFIAGDAQGNGGTQPERMRIVGDNGLVGIGTTNPGMTLQASRAAYYGGPAVGVDNGNGWLYMHGANANHSLIWNSEGDLRFGVETGRGTGYTERMRLTGAGALGIGTSSPSQLLDVRGTVQVQGSVRLDAADGPFITRGWDPFTSGSKTGFGRWGMWMEPGTLFLGIPGTDYGGTSSMRFGGWLLNSTRQDWMTILEGGSVGIGTSNPTAALHVVGSMKLHGGNSFEFGSDMPGKQQDAGKIGYQLFTVDSLDIVGAGTSGTNRKVRVWAEGGAHFTGRVSATTVEIRGGADIVEGFESSHGDLEPGTVVVIDDLNPGSIRSSSDAYDPKVAGIVSGAGGVNPGLKLGHEGVLDGGVKVAMTGRVYVKCSAENGAIRAGDRLTTASLAGHAMKATDAGRCDGAVIGKAMSNLEEGTGLVLVLVNLQ